MLLFFLIYNESVYATGVNEYVLTLGDEQVRLTAKPEAGYIIKAKGGTANFNTFHGTLRNIENVDIKAVRGFGEQGIYVLKSQIENNQNERILTSIEGRSDVEYALPLFEVEGAIVAIIPEIIVRLRHENDILQLMNFCERNDCRLIRNVIYTNMEYLLEPIHKTPENILNTIEELNNIDFIEWAFPDVALEVGLCGPSEADMQDRTEPNDEYFLQQWHLDMIRAPEAWNITQGDPNIVVAVIDAGFDIDHPDLVDNLWTNPGEIPGNGIDEDNNGFIDDMHGWDFIDGDNTLSGRSHGTMCAGLIAARGDNSIGVTGVTWNCKIMSIRADVSEEEGCVSGMALAEALRYAAANGADVINNSWVLIAQYTNIREPGVIRVGSFDCTYIHSAIKDITKLDGVGRNGKGCIVLFASGNWADGGYVMYPAKYPEVIAVGAVGMSGGHWQYSGSGPELDIVAPSGDTNMRGNLWTTDTLGISGVNNRDPNILDYTDKMGGTSGSCPIVAGVAALVLSMDHTLTNIEIANILFHSAKDLGPEGYDEEYGYGCVDAYNAINMTLNPQEFFFSLTMMH